MWRDLEASEPELAAFGAARLNGQVAYLATIRADGAPRVHPMTPIIGEGHLFVFMEPTSPKGRDLERDGRYAIHCGVSDTSGESGEFSIAGGAVRVTDPETRALAVNLSSYNPRERYILFEFGVDRAAMTTYPEGNPQYRRWNKTEE